MDNVVTQEVFKRIDALAEKLGTTAAYLWPKLVAHTWAQAVGSIATFSLAILALSIAFSRAIKAGNSSKWDTPGPVIATVFCVEGLIAVLIIAILGLPLGAVISPEGAAFYKLIGK